MLMKKDPQLDTDINNETLICRECQSGKMNQRFVTYLTWIGDELITVPDFPAWVCDVCGRCEYDGRALNRLSLLLSPNAGRPTNEGRNFRPKMRAIDNRTGRSKAK
jgi:YgiT-type zinc finger domain-containing protein